MRPSVSRIGLVLVLSLVGGSAAFGQATTASIEGVARDGTNAVLPGVTVVVKSIATGLERTSVTDESGFYKITNLPVGSYELRAVLDGFMEYIRRGFTLTIGQAATLNITMEVGSLREQVTVTGGTPMIDLATSTVSGLVDEKQLRALPLNSRDLLGLVPLQANAQFADTAQRAVSRGFGTKVSIGGNRHNQNYFSLDGTDIRDASGNAGGASGALTGVETVQEFEVITNAFTAEYGNYSGGVFNAITKSGTNAFRGSAF
jgi:hypothetical protein